MFRDYGPARPRGPSALRSGKSSDGGVRQTPGWGQGAIEVTALGLHVLICKVGAAASASRARGRQEA